MLIKTGKISQNGHFVLAIGLAKKYRINTLWQ